MAGNGKTADQVIQSVTFHVFTILIIPKRAQTRRITRFFTLCLLCQPILGSSNSLQPSLPLGRTVSLVKRSRFSARSKKPWRVAMRKPFERPTGFLRVWRFGAIFVRNGRCSTQKRKLRKFLQFQKKITGASELDHIGNLWGAETRNLLVIVVTNWSARMPDATGFIYQR